mmetsp:Transcript_13094/g.11182  ORF Transcript_13094/g.11182 Transcript_13094/m.11182 type:complete len:166 (+) Transcript_13094:55-552(+)
MEPLNNFYSKILDTCVEYKQFPEAIDFIRSAICKGAVIDFTSKNVAEIIEAVRNTELIFDLGMAMLKDDTGRNLIAELFPESVAEILLKGTSEDFNILFDENEEQGYPLSSHRYYNRDRRNANSTHVMVHKPGLNGKSWRFVPYSDGKHFKIVFQVDLDTECITA